MPFVSANVLQPLIDVFEQVLLFFHDTVGLGWGLSIMALTISVRTVLLPLTLKQFRSMAAMQKLAPEMKVLQAKYKDDRQRLNQEMMKFYQENKVNPFASCLPLLAQMPVFISLFYMLRKDLKEDICGPFERGTNIATTYCDKVKPGSAELPLHPGHHGARGRRRPRGAHRPLRRLAAALEPAHVDDGRQEPEAHHARAARSSSSSSS